jgi:putative hydrolase of the HAD superfamily
MDETRDPSDRRRPGLLPAAQLRPVSPEARVALQAARAILFDLGGTLVSYWRVGRGAMNLGRAVAAVRDLLRDRGLLRVGPEAIAESARDEHQEETDHRVRPLHDRLCSMFDVSEAEASAELRHAMCRRFTDVFFDDAVIFDDVPGGLERLRLRGHALGIVANTIWGGPAPMWRGHLRDVGLRPAVDAVTLSVDVGKCKPAPEVFLAACEQLAVEPERCVMVGDNREEDVAGASAAGIRAILIDRFHVGVEDAIGDLDELCRIVEDL